MRPLRKHANQETTLLKMCLDEAFENAEKNGIYSSRSSEAIDIKQIQCPRKMKISLNRFVREQLCSESIPYPEEDSARERVRSRVVIRQMRKRGERGLTAQMESRFLKPKP